MTPPDRSLATTGVDAVALKPAEVDLSRVAGLPVDALVVDYEGRDHVPSAGTLADLAATHAVRLTVPVRADGYDPRGEDSLLRTIPESVGLVAVAGHPAYLDDSERGRAIAPRLRAVAESAPDPWVGTAGVERVALAVGGTQYDLLSASTAREIRSLRAAGFDGAIAVYAPTVLSADEDRLLDAVGAYAARRPAVTLPEDAPTDSAATGRVRERLLRACRECALVGDAETVARRVDALHEAGVDHVVAYPAGGIEGHVG